MATGFGAETNDQNVDYRENNGDRAENIKRDTRKRRDTKGCALEYDFGKPQGELVRIETEYREVLDPERFPDE